MAALSLRDLLARARSARLVRVLGVYLVASYAAIQAVDLLSSQFGVPEWFFSMAVGILIMGLPIVITTALIQTARRPHVELGEGGLTPTAPAPLGRVFTWKRAILGGVFAFIALGSAGMGVSWLRNRGRALQPDVVAVMPFHVVGSEVEIWREGLVDLLSTGLDATGQFRSSDPRAVLNRWRSRVGDRDELPEPGKAAEVAGSLGAGRVILGSLIRTGPDDVRISADIYSVRWLRKEGSAAVSGSEDEITSLVDRLTVDLLKSVWAGDQVPDIRVSAITTASVPALRSYLEGEQAYRRSQFNDAQKAFTEAIEADSTFAIAFYRLAQTYGWFLGIEADEVKRYLAAAERHSQGLPERDSLLIRAWRLADVRGDLEAIPLFEHLTARYPDDLETWYGLGDAYFHLGAQAGLPVTRSIEPFEQALAFDSGFAPALIHLIETAYYTGDSIRGRDWTDHYLTLDSTSFYAQTFALLTALQFGPAEDSALAAAALDTASSTLLMWARARFRGAGATLPMYEMVTLAGATPRHADPDRAFAHWSLGLRYMRHGRISAALDLIEQALSLSGGNLDRSALYLVSMARNLGLATDSASKQLVDRLARKFSYRDEAAYMGPAAVREGRFEDAAAALSRIEAEADSILAQGDSATARSVRGRAWVLQGRIAAGQDSIDAAIAHLRRGLPTINANWNWPRDVARYWLATLIQDRGGEEEALSIYGSLYWNPWLEALGYFHRAELHERRGEPDGAVRYYSRFLALWTDADPHLQPRVVSARRALDRLTAETAAGVQ